MRYILYIVFSMQILFANTTQIKYSQELHNAVRSDNIEILNHTLDKFKTFINEKDQFGSTPLLLAVRLNNTQMVESILKYNPNTNLKDKFGDTALIESARANNMDILKLLICANANKDIKNIHGLGAMNFISENKQYEVALFIQNPQCNNDITNKKKQLIERLRELE